MKPLTEFLCNSYYYVEVLENNRFAYMLKTSEMQRVFSGSVVD